LKRGFFRQKGKGKFQDKVFRKRKSAFPLSERLAKSNLVCKIEKVV